MTAQLFDFPQSAPSMVDPPKRTKPKKKPYTAEFTAFWNVYPPRFNSSKYLAFKEWEHLDPEEQAQAMIAAPIYANRMRGKDEQFTKHAAHWLHGKYFETIAVPRPAQSSQTAQIDWASVMKLYRITSNWRQELGPVPGLPGCRVPTYLLGDME